MWIKLTHNANGKPIYMNTMHIVSVWNHPDDDITRVSTVEDANPWQVKENVEAVMNIIKMVELHEPLKEKEDA